MRAASSDTRSSIPASASRAGSRQPRTAGEHHGAGRAIQLGNGHHDRGFDWRKTLALRATFDALEFQRLHGDVGNIQLDQGRFRRLRVVEGRAHRPAKSRSGTAGHRWPPGRADRKTPIDRGSRIQAAGEGRNDAQAARLKPVDDRVIVRRVTRQHVRAHDQEADGADRLRGLGKAARSRVMRPGRGWYRPTSGYSRGGCGDKAVRRAWRGPAAYRCTSMRTRLAMLSLDPDSQ